MDEQNDKITLHRDGESIRIHIPLKFKRRGGRKEIITPDGLSAFQPERTAYQKPLVVALARAHLWQRLLDEGRVASISELAKRLKVDHAYISRLLHLTLLAPDIIEAILNGKEPSGLSLARLHDAFEPDWEMQRTKLGFQAD
ncbi:MAG: hypothetical protein M5R36_08545 [Deltaproteobacteria bacterium]|nr:hypothetical protein [Deltaproteobacteria bacterium]